MAKARKIQRPWQVGPRKKQPTPGPFWLVLADILRQEREARKLSTVGVEKNGGPSYGTVQEHENGDFRTVRALLLHLNAFGMDDASTFRRVLDVQGNVPVVDVEIENHIRNLQKMKPAVRASMYAIAHELGHRALSTESKSLAEFAEQLAQGKVPDQEEKSQTAPVKRRGLKTKR